MKPLVLDDFEIRLFKRAESHGVRFEMEQRPTDVILHYFTRGGIKYRGDQWCWHRPDFMTQEEIAAINQRKEQP